MLRADQVFRACELHYRGEELLGDLVLDEARAIFPKARRIERRFVQAHVAQELEIISAARFEAGRGAPLFRIVSMPIEMIRGLDT